MNQDLGISAILSIASSNATQHLITEHPPQLPGWLTTRFHSAEPFDKKALKAKRKAERDRKRDQRRKNRR